MSFTPIFNAFEDTASLEAKLSQEIAEKLAQAVAEKDSALLLLSGGNTPKALFQALSNIDIAWDKVTVSLVDDRWVPATHKDSNEATVLDNLIQNKAKSAHFISLFSEAESAEAGVAEITARFAHLNHAADVAVLGMGNDGHTASWFPCCQELDEALQTSAPLLATNPTTAPHARMTFSCDAIFKANQIYLHIVGAQKQDVYQQAISQNDIKAMPIRAAFAQTSAPFEVYWSK